jgi:nicotinate-nucleotide adenylyltransferase
VRAALGDIDLRLLPAGQPPHRDRVHASANQRLTMLRLALADHPGLAIDTREIEGSGPSWMVDTLEDLRCEYPQAPLCLVLGQDAANQLDSWRQWRRLPQLAHLVVMTRAGQAPRYSPELTAELLPRQVADVTALAASPAGSMMSVAVPDVAISSTAVRERAAAGMSLQGWVPGAVARFIADEGLYGVPARP